jgi:hypothetical protein
MKSAPVIAAAILGVAALALGPQLACGITHDDFESKCRLLNNQAQEAAQNAVKYYGLACSTDSDCAVVNESTSCSITCPTIGTAAAAAALPATLQSIESTTCADYTSTICVPAVVPPCVGTPAAVCVAGMCALAKFDAGASSVDASAPDDAGDAGDAGDADAADAGDGNLEDAATDAADAADSGDADAQVDAD